MTIHYRLASALLVLAACLTMSSSTAQQSDCGADVPAEQSFDSGAMWSLCLAVTEAHGLELSSIRYRAPGDTLRPVLQRLHLGQLLLHFHDQATAQAQVDPALNAMAGNDQSNIVELNDQTCADALLDVPTITRAVCSRLKDNRTLAKYAQRPSLHSQSWELISAFQREAHTWSVSVTFTEDGQVRPGVSLSGRATRTHNDPRYAQRLQSTRDALTRATIVSTWRMVFDLDSAASDRVELFEFPLNTELGNRRPMQVSSVDTESLQQVQRANFRGWRIVDDSGAGYYLDPANSGLSYTSQTMNWAQFDVAVTAYKPCERHALLNARSDASECGASLDDFVDGESLQQAQPVLWYSQTATFDPRLEDWPVIHDVLLTFDLLPFDWTASSPFELIE